MGIGLPVGANGLSVGGNELPVGGNRLSVGENGLPVGGDKLSSHPPKRSLQVGVTKAKSRNSGDNI